MNKQVYKKSNTKNVKKIIRFFGLFLSLTGLISGLYIFFPLLSWEMYVQPVFASQSFASPIPKTTIISNNDIGSLISAAGKSIRGIDYSHVQNWIPETYKEVQVTTQLSYYYLSIPKLQLKDLIVSTVDTDIDHHLVQFPGTAFPPNKGNTAIFGHSTLPQLFNPTNYKTIFANALQLKVGDTIEATVNNTLYTYHIVNITITDPQDTSYLAQQNDESYITIITCTPPGTIWKRLVIRAKLEKA